MGRVVALFHPERRESEAATLSGLELPGFHTQGSSFLATLGWWTQSLRDWKYM
jgi:hypothetical protein